MTQKSSGVTNITAFDHAAREGVEDARSLINQAP